MDPINDRKFTILLLASFVAIASLVGVLGLISLDLTEGAIYDLAGQQSTEVATSVIRQMEAVLFNEILNLEEFGNDPTIQEFLARRNSGGDGAVSGEISSHLREKASFSYRQVGYPTFTRILLTDSGGNKVADTRSGAAEDLSAQGWWQESREYYWHVEYAGDRLQDVPYGIDMSVRVDDRAGGFAGVLHATYSIENIIAVMEEAKRRSQFATSELDLFDSGYNLIHTTSADGEGRPVADFIGEIPTDTQAIDDKFAEINEQYERVLQEYGLANQDMTEAKLNELDSELTSIYIQYDRIDYLLTYGGVSQDEERELKGRMEALQAEEESIMREYGIAQPRLTYQQQLELEAKLSDLDQQLLLLYNDVDLDLNLGSKGYAIRDAVGGREVLYTYSRQTDYAKFPGMGWTLIMHTDMDDLLSDVASQRDSLLLVILSVTSVAVALGMYFARVFSLQSRRLGEAQQMSTIGLLSSNIAHDMRNPLGAIQSSTEIISGQNGGANERISKEVERIRRSVTRMSHQVEGVLNYVRTTPLIMGRHSVREMLAYAVDSLSIPPNVRLSMPEGDVMMECDREKLEITFVNLVLNAVQAIGGDEGAISVRVAERQGRVEIEFENSGPGIPPDQLGRVFEPLYTTRLRGTGLGLSSCKNIIEQHGGKIFARSDPVVFRVVLPVAKAGG